MSATEQLHSELLSVINRYGQESDMTVCEAVGVLELVKQELIEKAPRHD